MVYVVAVVAVVAVVFHRSNATQKMSVRYANAVQLSAVEQTGVVCYDMHCISHQTQGKQLQKRPLATLMALCHFSLATNL